MDRKLKLWKEEASWEEAERNWDLGAESAAQQLPLKKLEKLPRMPGMTPETAKHLKWKSLKWMVSKDHLGEVARGFFHHPIRYGMRYLFSLFKKKSYRREGDFFLYGISEVDDFQKLLETPHTLFVVGFSYCHKPFECPAGRFTPDCIRDAENQVCRQCFIGKAMNALPSDRTISLVIPTVHYIGGKIFEIVHAYPDKEVVFLITACEMTLEMFGDWGNMVGIKGIGVRLDGRICNTMRAFELSEEGVKPGLTVILEPTKQRILNLIKHWREKSLQTSSRDD